MPRNRTRPKSRFVPVLFGLVFFLPGVGMLLFGPAHRVLEHTMTAGWDQVPATLDEIRVDRQRDSEGTTTYAVRASYRYEYGGRQYHGTRVGYDRGSDNIGDFHHRVMGQLEQQSRNNAVQVWVNPGQPSESLLVRELRWRKMLFMTVFGLVFAGAGLFVMWLAMRRSAPASTGDHPISSSAQYGHWLFGFMAFAFLGVSLPVVMMLPDELSKGNWPVLAVLLFPLAGLWLGYMAWKSWRNWRYYGPAPLFMDPAPGQLGGDIGGRIVFTKRLDADADWAVTLQCLRVRITSGKNSSRHETLVWQQDQVPEAHHRAHGTELGFCFTPPVDLPESDDDGRDQVVWRLLLSGPTEPVALERSYDLPVIRGSQRSGITLSEAHVQHHEQQGRRQALTEAVEQVDVQRLGVGWVIHSRAGRNLGMKLSLTVFGLIFASVGAGLWYLAMTEGAMLYLMGGLFMLFGVPLTIGGVFMAGRGLTARIEGTRVTMIRHWLGLDLWKRQGQLGSADQLVLKSGVSQSQGGRTTEYFALVFQDGGKTIRIAEGLVGRPAGEAFRDSLVKLLGLA